MRLAVDEFVRIVKGRLSSAFLQQFGILVVATKRKDLKRARKALEVEGIHVYTCTPVDEKYELFCSKVLGVSSLGNFFSNLKIYEIDFLAPGRDLTREKRDLENNFGQLCS